MLVLDSLLELSSLLRKAAKFHFQIREFGSTGNGATEAEVSFARENVNHLERRYGQAFSLSPNLDL